MTDNPMDALRTLLKRLEKEASEIGLSLHHAAFMPNPEEDGPDVLQAVFAITPKAVEPEKTEEQTEIDAQFEAMMHGEKEAEREKSNEAAAQEIQGWLDGKE